MTYQKYEVTRSVKLHKYQKYDNYLLDRARDIRQKSLDHEIWVTVTTKYNEVTDSVRLNKYLKYDAFCLIPSEIQGLGKITGP